GAGRRRRPGPPDPGLAGAEHALRRGLVRPLPARPAAGVPRRPGGQPRRGRPSARDQGAVMKTKPRLAVWKLASCDGCQLTLLDCEDELLAIAGAVEIAHFTEASSAETGGPYDVSLVEGSVTTERDARRITEIRPASKFLVSTRP